MKTTRLIPSLAILALLSACSKKDSAEHFLDAQNYLVNQQYSAAIIELRSAVQQDPEDYRFRLALGQALMHSGDIVSAERELERALRYGAPHNEVAIDLVKAHFLAGNHAAVIALLPDSTELTDHSRMLMNSFKGLAEIELGDTPAALLHFEQLSNSEYPDVAAFATGYLRLMAQEPQEALSQLLTITANSDLYAESLLLQGKIHLASEDYAATITTLNQYIKLMPSMHLARLLLAQAYVADSQYAEGDKHLTQLLTLFPDQPMANYLKSIISFQNDDFTAAKQHSEKAIRQPNLAGQARVIAALSSVRLGLDSQALSHLESITDILQRMPDVHRLYAILQLRAGETEIASSILAQLPAQEQDLQLIATTAFELLRKGSVSSAQQLLSQYEQHGEMDAAALTTLGTIKLGIEGQQDGGIKDLEQALLLEPGRAQTLLILAINYLQRGEFEKTEKLADVWIADEEMRTAGYNLKAYTYFLQQDLDTAQELTGTALTLTPLHPFSSLLQALIKIRQGQFNEAQTQLRQSLDSNPTYLAGLRLLYTIDRQLGNTEDAMQRIQQLHQQYPQIYPARLLLARVMQDQQHYQKSIELLTDPGLTNTNRPDLHWLILIEANLMLKKNNEAISLAKQWFNQNPVNPTVGYTYANALTVNQQPEDALQVINQLLTEHPGQPKLVMGQLTLLSKLQRYDQALAVLNNLPAEIAERPDITFLTGRLKLMQGDMPASLTAFQKSYAANPSAETAIFIANNLASSGSEQKAQVFVEQHMAQYGSTPGLQTYLATMLLKTDSDQSKKIYKDLIAQQPDNVVALNNYAWLLLQNDQAAEAMFFAKRALELLPDNPDIIDTYGKVLLRLNQPHDALKQFEHSLRLRPAHNEVMLNYAEALANTNQYEKARAVLLKIESDEPAIIERQSKLQRQLP